MTKSISDSPVNHSVCKWCYWSYPLEEFAERCQDMGIQSVELLNPDEWQTVQLRGLTCALSNGVAKNAIEVGFNDQSQHARLRQEILEILPKAADRGIPQIIVFSGNRNGMDDMIGLENCAVGLEPVVKAAEKAGVQITMELLNSKIDHKDYMCDHTAWGAQLAEKIGSPNFKLLYDIYHMQIMEGDVIRTIQTYHEYIGHYHTGGVPGRNEIDETQELYYPAIIKAIQETGFKGYIAQEFIPRRDDKLASLQQGIDICNVSV
ncbi:MAG: TIM barrel protein [Bacteroidota bacterium]